MDILDKISGFDWDRGNRTKCEKHGITVEAIEDVFSRQIIILPDETHSEKERRFRAIGYMQDQRAMFVVFTLRHRGKKVLVRPISARYMHKKEIDLYEKEEAPDI